MRCAWVLVALVALPGPAWAQATGVLRITATLVDASRNQVPLARHALLVSDNPATREPRRVVTAADGSASVTLRPGSYTVESDRPTAYLGAAYQWTQMVEVVAGRETTLALSADNAEVVELTETSPAPGEAAPARDPALLASQWLDSVVTVWSPTTKASGFVVDSRGLVATDRTAVGMATSVEVQVAPTVKVAARVLLADPSRGTAILWVDPTVVAGRQPLALGCPPAASPSVDDGQELVALVASNTGPGDAVPGEVTGLQPRTVEADLRLPFGGSGGPAFNEAGAFVGLTAVRADAGARRDRDVAVVRASFVCEAVSAALEKMSGATPPDATRLPVEPSTPVAGGTVEAPARPASGDEPLAAGSDDFDVAFITPRMVARAGQRSDWTGGRSARSPEAEARLGRLTDFGAWADYVAGAPPVLLVRVTPKLVEGFWKRLAREAARTQGAVLPAFKDFRSSFLRLRASCGATAVTPIHPFVLEHRESEANVVREGLYVFAPDALGPHCGSVTLSLYEEKTPDRADTLTIDPKVVERLWQDLAPLREARRP